MTQPPLSNSSSRPPLIIQILSLLIPAVFGLTLMSLRMPPWAEEMSKLWGSGFIVLSIVTFGITRYFPPGTLSAYVQSQQAQAAAMASIAQTLMAVGRTLQEANMRLLRIELFLKLRVKPASSGNPEDDDLFTVGD